LDGQAQNFRARAVCDIVLSSAHEAPIFEARDRVGDAVEQKDCRRGHADGNTNESA